MPPRPPLDSALRQYLDSLAAYAPDPSMMDAERVALVRANMARALASRERIEGLPNAVDAADMRIAEDIKARLYRPDSVAQPALLLYFHGGGWVAGSIDSHDPFCRLLAHAAGVAVLSVDYRLAPEHPYPAPVNDALAALGWAARKVEALGCEGLAVGGDSAGANLAAVAANRLGGSIALRAQVLLYPVTDHPDGGHASYVENATGCGLEAGAMRWFWRQYADGVPAEDAGISPLRQAALPALPPTLVATADYDVLRDEAIAYARKLREAGVAVTHLHADGMTHNFAVAPGTVMRFPQSQAALGDIAAWLRETLYT